MNKISLTFGSLAGAIIITLMVINLPMTMSKEYFELGEVIGYTSMIIAMSMLFFGIRAFRDKHEGGTITFGRAFLAGLYMSAVASVVYAIGWEFYYRFVQPDFMEVYSQFVIERMTEEGASQAAILEKQTEMAGIASWYQNMFFRFGMTMAELLPVGIVVSLICAAILRKKPA